MLGKFFAEAWKGVTNMSNPVVGPQIFKLQSEKLLIRVCRPLDKIVEQGGLSSRVDKEEVFSVRFSNVERYQKFNENPFAYGACSSMQDLLVFVKQNQSHTNNGWIHKFYGKSTSLAFLKLATGIESDGFDNEKEELIVSHIPIEQFLFSTCPKYREKFLDGFLVPNHMHEYNSELPKSMRLGDILTEKDVLTWLLTNNCEETFSKVCKSLYPNIPQETLERRLEDRKLAEAVLNFLAAEEKLSLAM